MSKALSALPAVVASVAGFCASFAVADDLNPPPWRGQPDSTFQHWGFLPNTPQGAPDSGLNNPNGVPIMTPSDGGAFYEAQVGNRIGVWGLTSGDLRFHIPNDNEPDAIEKFIWIQVTWQGQLLPGLSGVSSTDHAMKLVNDPSTATLPDGWHHTTWLFRLDECPDFEIVFLTNTNPTGATLLIDQVVIDTICIVPAPGIGGLALAGLVLAGRRRR
ncbi:MAG: hypothetical protein JNM86_15935 [Phycisphaerae bacterium]|nr:hypothetical protein [Phycisphaerae bacterium]MBN8596274.1 hypothetical protein [Planctomycetota bacterium]